MTTTTPASQPLSHHLPRVVLAAPGSGHGKTSVATGLLGALAERGLAVSPHKVGPDYIDTGYHALAAGRPGRNLDPWMVGEDRVVPLLLHGAMSPIPADIAVVEGVMGLFDGCVHPSEPAGFSSTAHVAALIGAPVVLVVDASAQARSIAALVLGFATFDPAFRIGGVVLNRVGSDRHERILRSALQDIGVPVLGALRRLPELHAPSRHLGLVPAAERSVEALRTVRALTSVVSEAVDLSAVLALAGTSAPLVSTSWDPAAEVTRVSGPAPVVAVAGGSAFTFGYTETVELLQAAGAQVVVFDPLRDGRLPRGTRGLVLGGGFPEEHAVDLAANLGMRTDVAALVRTGAPVAAECAGLLYLSRSLDGAPMCDVLPVDAVMSPQLTLGYREAVAVTDSVLVPAGTTVRGHEFHRTRATPGQGSAPAWQWGQDAAPEGFVDGSVHASFLHLHWAGTPTIAERFVAAAARVGVGVRT